MASSEAEVVEQSYLLTLSAILLGTLGSTAVYSTLLMLSRYPAVGQTVPLMHSMIIQRSLKYLVNPTPGGGAFIWSSMIVNPYLCWHNVIFV